MTTHNRHLPAALWRTLFAALLLSLLAAGCGDDDDASGDASGEPIVREELGETAPSNAQGQHLYLERVTIQPGAELPRHFHEGTQVAYVESGVLTYNIVSGTAAITRSDGSEETADGPDVVTLNPGDSLVETIELVHFGSNDGDEPVVITLAALLAEGAPLSTTVEE